MDVDMTVGRNWGPNWPKRAPNRVLGQNYDILFIERKSQQNGKGNMEKPEGVREKSNKIGGSSIGRQIRPLYF